MADEKTVAEEATDENLDAAWKAANTEEETKTEEVETKTETKTEEKPPEEKPASAEAKGEETEEVLDHKESSRLGRKVKGLESRLDQILARLEPKSAETHEQIEEPDVITTPEDVRRVIQADVERSRTAKADYERTYLKQIDSLKTAEDDGLHDEIVAEMLKNHNVMYDIKNPSADARVNYAEAKASVLTNRYSGKTPRVPDRAKSETSPVQPAASASRTTAKPYTMPKLDEEARQFLGHIAKKEGKSLEQIAQEYGL